MPHSMQRRSSSHNYSAPGFYHVTMSVDKRLGQPLGHVAGDAAKPDGHPEAPRMALSPVGAMVERELLQSISAHYPMVQIDTYVVMPEHVHVLLNVRDKLLSYSGRTVHLGQVIAGFKYGCAKKAWQMRQADPAATAGDGLAATAGDGLAATAGGGLAAGSTSSPEKPSFPPLFARGYCDVMPVDARQLATQRAYIRNNPRSRVLRMQHPEWLRPQRGGIDTALTIPALRGYLQREKAASPDALAQMEHRLLLADGKVACHTYGNRALLTDRRCLPVVCHRKDASRLSEQKARCLDEAAKGAVLVSSRIAKGEQEIMNEAMAHGFAVILIADNGFADRYHPSGDHMDLCAESRLLIVTPWQYQYRPKDESISVTICKTMNCVAQALCRTKDSWWKEA